MEIAGDIPVLTAEESAAWDAFTIREKKTDSRLLMAWAGFAAWEILRRRKWMHSQKKIFLLCGKGNNGGDGYVFAWQLMNNLGLKTVIYSAGDAATEDAAYFQGLCRDHKLCEIRPLSALRPGSLKNRVLIDALYGTGFRGELSAELAELLRGINRSGCRVIALDIPSGLPADGSIFAHEPLKCRSTITFGSAKVGHVTEPGIIYTGKLRVAAIGFSREYPLPKRRLLRRISGKIRRSDTGNKYDSGTLAILGGSNGMEGAALMVGQGFLKNGGGLVHWFTSSARAAASLTVFPELMVISSETGNSWTDLLLKVSDSRCRVCVIGPGFSDGLDAAVLEQILKLDHLSLILDGSILGELRDHRALFSKHQLHRLILTPHGGEAKRLLGRELQNHLEDTAEISFTYRASVFFKGAGGIIHDHRSGWSLFCARPRPELATGGTGDVLCGFLAAAACADFKTDADLMEAAINRYYRRADAVAAKVSDFITASEIYSG